MVKLVVFFLKEVHSTINPAQGSNGAEYFLSAWHKQQNLFSPLRFAIIFTLIFLQINQSMYRHVYNKPLLIFDIFKLDLQRQEHKKTYLPCFCALSTSYLLWAMFSFFSLKHCLHTIKKQQQQTNKPWSF